MTFLPKIYNFFVTRPLCYFLLGSCGRKFRLGPSSQLHRLNNICIGDNFFTGPGCYMSTSVLAKIQIGNDVMFGPKVTVLGGNHNIDLTGMPMTKAPYHPERDKGIVIENDVWVGAGVILLDGAYLSEGTVIAAGAVVNKVTEPFSVYGGVPAKLIKYRS